MSRCVRDLHSPAGLKHRPATEDYDSRRRVALHIIAPAPASALTGMDLSRPIPHPASEEVVEAMRQRILQVAPVTFVSHYLPSS